MELISTAGLNIFLEAGAVEKDSEWKSTIAAGYWFGALLSGRVAIEQDLFGPSIWKGGDAIAFATDQAFNTNHRAIQDDTLAAVFLQIEPDAASGILGSDTLEALAENDASDAKLFSDIGRVIAGQMLNCHLHGPARRLYLTGKALEFVSHIVDAAQRHREHKEARQRWTPRDIAQLKQAEDILLSSLKDPPTVTELARMVGTNARKLGAGFNDLFGMPVYAFVKTRRLDAARVLLESGETSVSVVAQRFGYQPQHFATEFRRRFGVSPSRFTGKRDRTA